MLQKPTKEGRQVQHTVRHITQLQLPVTPSPNQLPNFPSRPRSLNSCV